MCVWWIDWTTVSYTEEWRRTTSALDNIFVEELFMLRWMIKWVIKYFLSCFVKKPLSIGYSKDCNHINHWLKKMCDNFYIHKMFVFELYKTRTTRGQQNHRPSSKVIRAAKLYGTSSCGWKKKKRSRVRRERERGRKVEGQGREKVNGMIAVVWVIAIINYGAWLVRAAYTSLITPFGREHNFFLPA